MFSTIATVFLVMITVAALAVLWGVVFPFIENALDVENLDVRLDIVTDTGYTVYDPTSQFAMIQVRRITFVYDTIRISHFHLDALNITI